MIDKLRASWCERPTPMSPVIPLDDDPLVPGEGGAEASPEETPYIVEVDVPPQYIPLPSSR